MNGPHPPSPPLPWPPATGEGGDPTKPNPNQLLTPHPAPPSPVRVANGSDLCGATRYEWPSPPLPWPTATGEGGIQPNPIACTPSGSPLACSRSERERGAGGVRAKHPHPQPPETLDTRKDSAMQNSEARIQHPEALFSERGGTKTPERTSRRCS